MLKKSFSFLSKLIFIALAIPQMSGASDACIKQTLPLTLKEAIQIFADSGIGKQWMNHRLIESLKLIQSLALRVPEDYIYRFQIFFKPTDSSGAPIDTEALLLGFSDLARDTYDSGKRVYLFVPFNRLPAILYAATRPEFERAIDAFGAYDIQGADLSAHVNAEASSNIRNIQVQNSYIDRFIFERGGANHMELVAPPPSVGSYKTRTRTYVLGRKKFLTFPKEIAVKHSFGKKYDRFIQLGIAKTLADILRLNLGDESVGASLRPPVTASFLFQDIVDVKINVIGIKKFPTSDIPYKVTLEIEVLGIKDARPLVTDSSLTRRLSRQIFSSEIEFEGSMIFLPHGGITDISFW